MKSPHFPLFLVGALIAPLALQATTDTWKSSPSNNTFGNSSNWTPGIAAGDDLVFSSTSQSSISAGIAITANSISFTGAFPHYFFSSSGSGSINLGAGGITLDNTGTSTGTSSVDFNGNLPIALTANQTWTTNGPTAGNLTVSGSVSGAFALTKAGSGYLALNGNNSYSGGTTINAGTLYLGQSTGAGTGSITVASSGTLAPSNGSDLSIANTVSLASGATLGGALSSTSDGQIKFTSAATITPSSGAATLNVGGSEVVFDSTFGATAANTALTVHGSGQTAVVFKSSTSNFDSMIADNAGIGFGTTSSLPAVSVQAINGGYVSVADIGGTTPTPTALLALITDKTNFNGTIGFDTGDQATAVHVYSDALDLSGFTSGQVSLGSATGAVLTGAITPAGSRYDFAGLGSQGGVLVVQSNLLEHGAGTVVNVTSPNSNGAGNGGMGVIFQGNNTFTGKLSVSNSGAILDSANALPSKNFSLGADSYVGITENATAYTNFADFQSHLQSGYTSTSILGLDSHAVLSDLLNRTTVNAADVRTVNDNIDLSGLDFITFGTASGVTIGSGVTIKAPGDGVLRLVSLNDDTGKFTINAPLTTTNGITSVVVGMSGASGTTVLTGNNNYTGGTTLQGGSLLVDNGNALGTGSITALTASASDIRLGVSTGSVTLSNNIAVTDNLIIGTGTTDDNGNFTAGTTSLTLTGNISNNSGNGRLYITGPTTLGGANTYSGGTYVEANTTVTSNSGLGTFFVDIGYNSTLTFTSANPVVGLLADASNFISGAGTGNVALGSGTLTITGQSSSGSFSGVISGTGGFTMAGNASGPTQIQTLTGANTYTGVTTLTSGVLAVSSIGNGGVAGGLGQATNAAANLVFNGGTLQYNGNTASTDRNFTINSGKNAIVSVNSSSTTLTMSGAGAASTGGFSKTGPGTLVLSGANLFTGTTSVNGGKLFVNGSLAGAVSVGNGAILGGSGTINGLGTIQSGAHLAPGVSVGTLTFTSGLTLNSGSILDFDVGTGSDKIFVTGGTLSGPVTGSITLNLSNSGGFVAGTYTLFDFTGASIAGSSFDTTDFVFGSLPAGTSANYSLSIVSNQLQLTSTVSAVPEPSTYAALIGAAALGAAGWRRRRRAATATA
ncbi:MAG TPA: autotransporter-associated beta strand repeat-containing protein [Opitutaceae bacterium]|nr:autotransporter-associated beta strand repeat-containing protein [Opitutaceae bacterium]